jgi:16S rRNA (uracil1498-N3)-methyltransferase
MPAERYFLNETLNTHDKKILRGTEFHHLVHVMRTRKGEEVELINGRGALAHATTQDLFKDHASLIINQIDTTVPRPIQVILAQALPKINRLDFILEKGTELGVDEFWLFPGQLSVKKDISPNQVERFNSLIIAAMKQCGRLFLPKIVIKPELGKWPAIEGTAFFGDVEKEALPFAHQWKQTAINSPILFFVGPESGFTEKEVQILRDKNVKGVKLHQYILRTETAPLMALSLIEHWLL